jgi:hypothetical protein
MSIDTSRISGHAAADLMRSLGEALDAFRRSEDYAKKINGYKEHQRERTKQ